MKLFKKHGKFWVDYTVDGKRHRQSTGTANRKLAEAWMANIKTASRMPTFESAVEVLKMLYQKPADGLLPVDGLWETYERIANAVGKTVSPDTLRKRKNYVDRFATWMKEKRPTVKTIETVTGPIAAAFAEHLAGEGLKTKTRRNIIGDLSTVWNMLEKASTGVRNPWLHLSPPDTDGERGKAFSKTQEAAVLKAAKDVGKDWYPICFIMRSTGLRYGDVATMEWKEIDGDVIRLDPNKTKRHGISVAIPIIDSVKKVLKAIPKRGDFLFPMHSECYARPGAQTRAGLIFREVLEKAGVTGTGYSIHSWRHTAATRLAEAGAGIETRKRILGHNEDVTARRYDHDEHLAETRQALEASAV